MYKSFRTVHRPAHDIISEIVAQEIPTHDLIGVTHLFPTQTLQFPIREGTVLSHELHEHHSFGNGFRHSDMGQAIDRSIGSLVKRSSDILVYYQGLRACISQFVALPPYYLALVFGAAGLTSSDPKLYPRYVCLMEPSPLGLHFTFGVPVDSSAAETLEGTLSFRELRRRYRRKTSL
ncbi:MAG: hypothetical protein ACE5OZ_12695 [Candidatus Heimdallarchaeota archaeon]